MDLKLDYNQDGTVRINLDATVEGKAQNVQSHIINLATERTTKDLWELRGTSLLTDAISGRIVDKNQAMHVGNFAALDSLYFADTIAGLDTKRGPDEAEEIYLDALSYDNKNSTISYSVTFLFADGAKFVNVSNIKQAL